MSRWNPRTVFFVISGAEPFMGSTIWVVGAVYYVLAVHMNPFQLVLVGTALELAYLIAQVPTGLFADLVSRRLSIVLGWLIVGACWIAEGLFPTFGVVIAAEAVRGLGEAFKSGAQSAWLADEVGEAEVGSVMIGAARVSQVTGMIGTVLGVVLASFRLNLPIVTGGVCLIATGAALAVIMPEAGFRPADRAGVGHRQIIKDTLGAGIRGIRSSHVLLTLVAVTLIWGAASEGFDRLWEAHLIRDITLPHLAAFKPLVWFAVISIGTSAVCMAALALFRERLQRATQSQRATAQALLLLYGTVVVSTILFGLAPSLIVALAMLVLRAVCRTLEGPLYENWLIQNIDTRVRATVLSMTSQADALGQIAVGPGVGAIGALVSLRAAIVTAGLLLSPALPLFARTVQRERRAAVEVARELSA